MTAEDYMNMAMDAFKNSDPPNCFKYCKKAAEMGAVNGMCSVANFYWEGVGVKKNHKKLWNGF